MTQGFLLNLGGNHVEKIVVRSRDRQVVICKCLLLSNRASFKLTNVSYNRPDSKASAGDLVKTVSIHFLA